ncbi:hypothetical protein BDW22DRAFT_1427105 [Trametopsis cervina]|nr:hypothetical protein BDW22DRAFT_1427105 [Trametopsis cervina]
MTAGRSPRSSYGTSPRPHSTSPSLSSRGRSSAPLPRGRSPAPLPRGMSPVPSPHGMSMVGHVTNRASAHCSSSGSLKRTHKDLVDELASSAPQKGNMISIHEKQVEAKVHEWTAKKAKYEGKAAITQTHAAIQELESKQAHKLKMEELQARERAAARAHELEMKNLAIKEQELELRRKSLEFQLLNPQVGFPNMSDDSVFPDFGST